jgi:hypothetical protein
VKFTIIILLVYIVCNTQVFGQDLLKERIRKIGGKKSSIYIENGIFHNGGVKQDSVIKAIRQSYNSKQGFERIVIDFSTSNIPKVYGHISADEKKIYIDFFSSNLAKDFQAVSKTKFIEKVSVFPIEENYLSVELKLKAKSSADVFFLENPGRLVIDIKN